jgi:hypothetical protein
LVSSLAATITNLYVVLLGLPCSLTLLRLRTTCATAPFRLPLRLGLLVRAKAGRFLSIGKSSKTRAIMCRALVVLIVTAVVVRRVKVVTVVPRMSLPRKA